MTHTKSPRILKAKMVGALGAVITILLSSGIAAAFWTNNGTGAGAAQTIAAQAVTVTAGVPATAQLYPGGKGDVTITVTNTNPYPVSVTEIDAPTSLSAITAVDAGTSATVAACSGSATGLTFTNWLNSGAKVLSSAITLAATNGTYTFVLTGTNGGVSMTTSSDSSCGTANGVKFTIPGFTVKATSTGPVNAATSTGSPLSVTVS